MKDCAKCGLEKEAVEFTKLSRASDGLHYRCRSCQSGDRKKYYDPVKNAENCKRYHGANKEAIAEYRKTYYLKNSDRMKAQASEWYRQNPERAKANKLKRYLRVRGTEDHKKYMAAAQRKFLASGGRETLQHGARMAVYWAIRCGALERMPCEKCGSEKDIHAHHYKGYDLANWFAVQWLCHEHHCEAHGWEKHKVEVS